MEISIKFLLQSVKVINEKKYINQDLYLIYDFLISVEKKELIKYLKSNTVLSYKNDLELYMETIIRLIKIFEDLEYYEECIELKRKIDECNTILNEEPPN
jgi:hypothetical protein